VAFTRRATFVARLPELRGGSHNFGFSIGLPPACGETWNEPVATDLACPPSPCTIKRIPKTGDLLVIWNQVSRWESMQGLTRTGSVAPSAAMRVRLGITIATWNRSTTRHMLSRSASAPSCTARRASRLAEADITATYGMDITDVMKKAGFEPNPKDPNRPLGNNKVRVLSIDWFYE